MDENFSKFNDIFPNSQFRRIKPGTKVPESANIYTYNQVKNDTERVGWIVNPGYIVVDIDDMDAAQRVKRWLQSSEFNYCLFYTVRGMHFVFKAPKNSDIMNSAHCMTVLGIVADYRTAGKGYIVLPFNDPEREWMDLISDMSELPIFLRPVSSTKCTEPSGLIGLSDGDGRNDALYVWKGKIQHVPGLGAQGVIDAIRIINTYVFNDPISEQEVSATIMRAAEVNKVQEAQKAAASVDDKKPLSVRELECTYAMREDMEFRVLNYQALYVYTGRYYKFVSDREIEALIITKYDPLMREASRKEVISKLKLMCQAVDNDNKFWSYVSFNNCVVNISTMETFEPSSEMFVTVAVNRDYVPDIPVSERIEAYLAHCSTSDVTKRQLILEMLGDCFLQRAVFQKMYLIYGEGGTGKSTLLRVITECVGSENATFLSTKDLETTFLPYELLGKLVNIGDDIPFTKIQDSSQIKKLVSGEAIMVQRKFGQPLFMNNYATLIFTANLLPNTTDRTSGWMRRLCLIDMNTRVTDPTAFFATTFTNEDYEYLLLIALQAIHDALVRGELTQSYVVDKNLEAYKKQQSSLSEFIDDNEITKEYLVGRSTNEVFAEYSHYCSENSMRPLGKHYLVSDLCALYYLTTEKYKDSDGNVAPRFTYVTNKTN